MSEDIAAIWKSLMGELDSDAFLGPYINRTGIFEAFSANLTHTGLCLQAAIPEAKIDVPILAHKSSIWWRKSNYVVPIDGVDFSFARLSVQHRSIDGFLVLPFLSLLGTIAGRRRIKCEELFILLDSLESILEKSGGAPLKKNAMSTLIPKYSDIGFATAPAKLQKTSVVIRSGCKSH